MSSLSPTLGRVPAPSPATQPGPSPATQPGPTPPSGAERVQAPDSPARARSTPVDGVAVLGAISPSRAADFATCPLLYRFRVVDRLPEPVSPQAARGTLVHKVLETLFDLPADQRTPVRARELLAPAWASLVEQDDALAELAAQTDEAAGTDAWLAGCASVLERWFSLEDPQRLEPAEREAYVEALLDSRLLLRGFVDRIDVAPDGAVRIVDYKTGRSPGPAYEAQALFQMRFYALVLWRARAVVPAMLQLVYLGNGEILRYAPDEDDLRATQRRVEALWHAIQTARSDGDWRPSTGRHCDWCSFKALCPAYGGTPPPLPEDASSPGPPASVGTPSPVALTLTAAPTHP